MINEEVIKKMKVTHEEEFAGVSLSDMKALVKRGLSILEDDQKALDQGIVRSHYQMSEGEKMAMSAAGIYNIATGVEDEFLKQFPEGEEEE